MGIEGLTELELIEGFLGTISLIITIFVGLRIVWKYFTFKRIEFITIGFTMVSLTSGWWGANFSFWAYLIFDIVLPDVIYFFLSQGFTPLAIILWVYSFCHLVYPKSKWKIVSIIVVIGILYEIFFIIFLITDPTIIGTKITKFDAEFHLFVFSYIIFSLIVSLITNIIFFKHCLRSEDPKIRWKGKFVFIGFIVFLIAAILDSGIPLNPITLFITRLMLVFSSIISYIGWIMPDRVARWLIKEG